jgi:hypothetical protein
MKKQIAIVGLSISLLIAPLPHSNAVVKKFKNCTELNKIYPGGVAKPGAVNKGGVTKQQPTINRALYTANIKSDRDKDGIACER